MCWLLVGDENVLKRGEKNKSKFKTVDRPLGNGSLKIGEINMYNSPFDGPQSNIVLTLEYILRQ